MKNSFDGINFTKIAIINAAGNSSSQKNYIYIVKNRKNYGNYYRLKMVDTDLSSRDSKIEFFGKDCDAKNTAPVIYYTPQTGIIISLSSNTELV